MTQALASTGEQQTSKTNIIALVAIFTAIVALSLAAIFTRLSEYELGPFGTIFNRFWIAALVFWLINLFQTKKEKQKEHQESYTRKDVIWLGVSGIMFWGCLACWAWSLTQTGVANSTILHNLTPLFTTLVGWMLFRQRFDNRFLLGLALAMVGATALGLGDLEAGADNLMGDFAALLSAAFSAANLMLIERLRAKFSASTIIFWCCTVGMLLSFPVALLLEGRIFPVSLSGWLAVISLAVVCQVVGQGLQAYSLKSLPCGIVGIFLLLDPVLAALVAWAVFAESLSLSNWIAFFVILVGMYLAKSSRYGNGEAEEKEEQQVVVSTQPQLQQRVVRRRLALVSR